MGFGAHGEQPKINTDYKIYTLDKAPQLQQFEARLKAQGLKDPWLRNEAWRFMGPDHMVNKKALYNFRNTFKMFPQALAAVLVTYVATQAYYVVKDKQKHGHDHDHGHH